MSSGPFALLHTDAEADTRCQVTFMPMSTGKSSVAKLLLNLAVAEPRSLLHRLLSTIALWARRVLTARADPIVEYTLGTRRVLLPLSHDLPLILASCPHYGQNLVRLVEVVTHAKGSRSFIDIGANVGDTIIVVRAGVDVAALAIEGDERYGSLLAANLADMPDVEIERSYVASSLSTGSIEVRRARGTAALISSDTESSVVLRPLTEILAEHPRFASAGVVKIDTDGADAAIIVANADWFAEIKPVVFLEYDSILAARLGDPEPWRAFEVLAQAGYGQALVYVNTGELLMEAAVTDGSMWRDLASYAASPTRSHYFDVAAFPADDVELFKRFLTDERVRFGGLPL